MARYGRGVSTGFAIALVVVDLLLIVAMGVLIKRRRGRLLPFVLAVLAGVVAVWAVATIVLLATS